MQAIILAGGLGTRLQSLGSEMPKSMLNIGDKPLLERQVLLLRRYGIHEIIFIVNHLRDSIKSYFGDGKKFGVSVTYYEEPTPLGTVGGIKAVEDQLKEDFIVLYGDVMLDMDIERLIQFHHNKKSECTLVVHPNDHPYDSDLVDIDNDYRLTGFYPKPGGDKKFYRNLVNAGVYILSKKVLAYLEKDKKADFGKDVFPMIINKLQVHGYNTSEYLKDMGTPERLKQVNADYQSGKIARRSFANLQKAIFLDRDGVLVHDKEYISKPDELELYSFTSEAIKKINQSDYLAIVATNQPVVARNLCTEIELRTIHNKLDTELGNAHAKIDALYYCPHHPDKGFPGENPVYKVDCDCRKPKPGMLMKAAQEFHVDLSQSYFIGDDERDIEAGKRAGVKTIGVRTGKGLQGSRLQPDFVFNDLNEAVDFILQ